MRLKEFSEAFAERIRQRLTRRKNVEEKELFVGVGFLLKGKMLVGVWQEIISDLKIRIEKIKTE